MYSIRNYILKKYRISMCRYSLIKRKAKGWLFPRAPLGVMSLTAGQHVPLPLLWLPGTRWHVVGKGITVGDRTFWAAEDKVGKRARHKLICETGLIKVRISYDVTIVPWETNTRALVFTCKYLQLRDFPVSMTKIKYGNTSDHRFPS